MEWKQKSNQIETIEKSKVSIGSDEAIRTKESTSSSISTTKKNAKERMQCNESKQIIDANQTERSKSNLSLTSQSYLARRKQKRRDVMIQILSIN